MGDDEQLCKVVYIDLPDGSTEETNWIKRAGKCQVTYPNGHYFEGTFDAERIKQGDGKYIWMGPGSEEDETPVEKAKYEGKYKDGMKHGYGVMNFPNGDVYQGEWFENKMHGEGTYRYKKSNDVYSGSWSFNLKKGNGTYEFGGDSSMMIGMWENGQIITGKWVMKGAAVYEGSFKKGRPFGPGQFSFESGLKQSGSYVEKKATEEDEVTEEAEGAKLPNVAWVGEPIVSF